MFGFRRARLADGTPVVLLQPAHNEIRLVEALPGTDGARLRETVIADAEIGLDGALEVAAGQQGVYGLACLRGAATALTPAVRSAAWVRGQWIEADLTDGVLAASADALRAAATDAAAAQALGVLLHDAVEPGEDRIEASDFDPVDPAGDLAEFASALEGFFGVSVTALDDGTIALWRALMAAHRPALPDAGDVPAANGATEWAVRGWSFGDSGDSHRAWTVGVYERRADAERHAAAAGRFADALSARYGRNPPRGMNPWDPTALSGHARYEVEAVRRLSPGRRTCAEAEVERLRGLDDAAVAHQLADAEHSDVRLLLDLVVAHDGGFPLDAATARQVDPAARYLVDAGYADQDFADADAVAPPFRLRATERGLRLHAQIAVRQHLPATRL